MNIELILGIVGIVGSLIGAWAYVQKREADTRVKQADTSLRDAETRAKQAEADAAQINGLMDMFKQQLLINQQQTDRDKVWADMLREKETRDERNYQVLKGLGDDNTRYLSGQLETLNKNVLTAIESIPAKIETVSVALATEIGQQIGARVAEEIFRRVPGDDLYPFPDWDDPRWEIRTIKPRVKDVGLYKRPEFDDGGRYTVTPLAETGEAVLIIEHRVKGWHSIQRNGGKPAAWGWLPAHSVEIVGEAEAAV